MPRRWFQIHLSTCILLMFVASALVGANLTERDEFFRGYPFIAAATTLIDGAAGETLSTALENYPVENLLPAGRASVFELHGKSYSVFPLRLAADAIFGFCVLLVAAVCCETLLRKYPLHISTRIALITAATIFVLINFYSRTFPDVDQTTIQLTGFPNVYATRYWTRISWMSSSGIHLWPEEWNFEAVPLIINLAFAGIVLTSIACLLEILLLPRFIFRPRSTR